VATVSRPERILQPGRSALDRFGYELRQLRKERGYSLARLAGMVYVSADLIQKIETAERRPGRELAGRLDKALQGDGALLERWRELSSESGARAVTVVSTDQERRVIQALDAIGNRHLSDIVDSLGGLIDHYALTICMLPPADVYDELLAVRSHASGIIERAGLALRRTDLVVAAGWLSNLLAIAACDMGEHAAARVWCSDAERRSRDARCPELAAWAVLTQAMIAFYQGQPRQSVTLAARGRESVPIGTVIHAKLATQEMRAAAMVGDTVCMAHARRYAAKAIAGLSPDANVTGAFSIALGEDPPYTATSLLLTGHFREAVSATNRVIQTVYQPEARQRGEHPSGYARSLLILGLAQAGAGRLDEAVAAGHSALAGSRPAWPTMVLAGKLDHVLAQDFANARQSDEYHARYLEATSHPVGHQLQLPSPH
jgi:transcriptional regulator with XRE-family HTH domain